MAHPNEDLVREGFAAFGRGDLDALRDQYFAEDIRYHFPGRNPLAGDYQGVAQVLELFGRAFELTGGTLRLELHDVLANEEHAVALFTTRAERAGRAWEEAARRQREQAQLTEFTRTGPPGEFAGLGAMQVARKRRRPAHLPPKGEPLGSRKAHGVDQSLHNGMLVPHPATFALLLR